MNKLIKNTLEAIEQNGYEAYIIGGYVRDYLLHKNSYDVDICTNATPKELVKIFPQASSKNLGGVEFKLKEYNFEITTYREEIKYENRHPIEYNYINNLLVDLNRRDFTINAICMNSKGKIIDLLDGKKDITNHLIVMIGDIDTKFKEDPLRIMRAIRLATVLDFEIEEKLYLAIKKYQKTILNLSKTRIKEELDKILFSENVAKGLNILKETGILDLLDLTYENIVPVKNLEGMYAQINISYELPFTKVEKENIKLNTINKEIVYKYGLYLAKIGAAILKIKDKEVNKIYQNLPIKEKKDIAITPEEIIATLNLKNKKNISTILTELEKLIISGKIKNTRKDIVKYLLDNKTRWS